MYRKSAGQENDAFGLDEIQGKSIDDILRLLINRKNQMDSWFEICSTESGFRDMMDNRQMGKDFWLYYLAKQLDFCVMNRTQKAKVLDLLLDAFHVENPMDAMSHFTYMNTNDSYYQYMNHCFGIADPDCAVFWILFSSMAGNDGERLSMTMGFIRSHMRFMMQLERYLQIMFPEWGFGQNMKNYMIRLNKYVLAALDGDRHAAANPDYLVNPIYPCM